MKAKFLSVVWFLLVTLPKWCLWKPIKLYWHLLRVSPNFRGCAIGIVALVAATLTLQRYYVSNWKDELALTYGLIWLTVSAFHFGVAAIYEPPTSKVVISGRHGH